MIVDKKLLLSEEVGLIIGSLLPEITTLVQQVPRVDADFKPDGSPVTQLDRMISERIKHAFGHRFPEVNFFCEEDEQKWVFPMLAVDPVDGTRELIRGIPEWAVSIAFLASPVLTGLGCIFNPRTGECFDAQSLVEGHVPKPVYRGEVSRSEWEQGLFRGDSSTRFQLAPMGSIAYKLGRLSAGKIDFVVSLRPKNFWDVAAGTLLCRGAGIRFYSRGEEVTEARPSYEPPLLWCRAEIFSELPASWRLGKGP